MDASPDHLTDEPLRPARWYHLVGGERQGPVALADMRELVLEGTLLPESWVWADGMADWMRLREVPALVPPRTLRVTLTAWPDDAGSEDDAAPGEQLGG